MGTVLSLAVSVASPELLSAGRFTGAGTSLKPSTRLCPVSSAAPAVASLTAFSSKEEASSSPAGLSGWDVRRAHPEPGLEERAQLTAGTCSVVPQVLQSCAGFTEQHGVVQGMSREHRVLSSLAGAGSCY